LAISAGLTLALLAGAAGARAQQQQPLALDPAAANQGTTLLVTADESLLSPDEQPARSIGIGLARGMRIDTAARETLCSRGEAARFTCPDSSRIGFGRFSLAVRGYATASSETEVSWAVDAYLGQPQRRGDVGSVVLTGRLLGADLVGTFLTPALGTPLPPTTNTVGRLIPRASGRYGIELQFPALPVQVAVAAPAMAVPTRLELTLTAVRRRRQDFVRRIEVRTPSGQEIRKIRDHRLIGQYLLRTPRSCDGSWPFELRLGFPGRVARTTHRIACTSGAGAAPA
jgi:hypothetical protein